MAPTLLCALLLSQGCQSRLTTRSGDSASSGTSSSEPALAFGPEAWRTHFGVDVGGGIPSLPSDIDQILDSPCPFWSDKQVRDTHVLVLVPSEVDGEPYTLTKLGELSRPGYPKNSAGYGHYDSDVKAQLGSVSTQAPCWVLLTRDIIPGSRNTSYEDQKKLLVVARASKTSRNYGFPSALEASTAILAHYVRSSERLFSKGSVTYTRCQDLVEWGRGRYPAVVGGFGSTGLHVDYDFYDVSNYCGVSGCRKFF